MWAPLFSAGHKQAIILGDSLCEVKSQGSEQWGSPALTTQPGFLEILWQDWET